MAKPGRPKNGAEYSEGITLKLGEGEKNYLFDAAFKGCYTRKFKHWALSVLFPAAEKVLGYSLEEYRKGLK